MEVKITTMQEMHIFRRDRMTQLVKCTPWSMRLCPHPTIVKKMRTFLEVEGKMGLIPQPTSSQYIHPQLDTNPNVRKDKVTEKRIRVVPTMRVKANTAPKPSEAAAHPSATISKAQPMPNPKHKKELQITDPHP